MARLAAEQGVRYVSLFAILCDGEGCLTRLGDTLLDLVVFDDAHLNAHASEYVVAKMQEEILP